MKSLMKTGIAFLFISPMLFFVGCGGGGENKKPTTNEVQDYLKNNPELLEPSKNADTSAPP